MNHFYYEKYDTFIHTKLNDPITCPTFNLKNTPLKKLFLNPWSGKI